MKKNLILLATLLIAGAAFSQDNQDGMRTLLGQNKKVSHGGYGALTFGYSSIDGKDAFQMGFKGGWVIDHVVTLGIAGTSFINEIRAPHSVSGERTHLTGGYGGLLIEPVVAPFAPVHIAFPVIIGAGGIAQVKYSWWNHYDHADAKVLQSDAFFVIEPGIEVQANIVRFFRVAFGVSYRHTSALLMANTPSDALRGLNVGISLKFGKF